MKLVAVCLGQAEKLLGKSYRTGIYKSAVSAAIMVDRLGLVGDAICNKEHHGGEDQGILLEGSITRQWWAAELDRELPPGMFGENLLVEGLDNRDVAAGDRFHIGDVVLEASMPRIPCLTLAARMEDARFAKTYMRSGRPGIYCRVIRTGTISPGETVRYETYAGERIGMPELFKACGERLPQAERQRYLAAPIGERLRIMLQGWS